MKSMVLLSTFFRYHFE